MSDKEKGGIICAGSLVYDILVKPFGELRFGTTTFVDSIEYRIGGNAANTARALAILGVPVYILGAVGSDAQADFILDGLRSCGVDSNGVIRQSKPTATSVALIGADGQRQFLHRLGASEDAFAQPVAFAGDLRKGFSHLHLSSLFVVPHLRMNGRKILADAKHAGLTTSFDTNWDPYGEWMQALQPCLTQIDIFFMNEDEARMITGHVEAHAAARVLLEEGVSLVVIKLGHRGCAIYGREEVVCPAFPVNAVDTTGAGDCFVAGFLAAHQQGLPLPEIARFANAVGALSVQRIGAVEGVISRDRVRDWIASQGEAVRS
ncbi:MAG TPA: carbohydrate kinase family protein [Terriglobales bacterium]|nr:carbohydrate kinase family protein [Terriglobales bacterium]